MKKGWREKETDCKKQWIMLLRFPGAHITSYNLQGVKFTRDLTNL